MTEKIRVLVADDSDDTRELVMQMISLTDSLDLVGEARSGLEVLEMLKNGLPDVVLMDINMPGLNGLETTERISKLYPTLLVVIMSVQGETEYLRKAMISGAREYLIKPFNMEVMEETIKSAFGLEKDRRQAYQASQDQLNMEGKSRVITFFSSKGGVGKSVLALNSALTLVRSGEGKTVLVDLDLQFGDIGILGNLSPVRTLSDAADDNVLSDPELLKGYLQNIDGVDVLMAPKKPEMAEYITEQQVQTVLNTLRKMYKNIIVDTAVNFSEINLGVLDFSDRIFWVSTLDLLSLKNTRLGLDVIHSLHHMEKVSLIINRFEKTTGISPSDVEKVLGYKPVAYLPEEERLMVDSINQGIPMATDKKYRATKFYKALEAMVKGWDAL